MENELMSAIVEACANAAGVRIADIRNSNSRKTEHIVARHVAMYLCATYSGLPLKKIAKFFAKNDHSSIIHARDSVRYALSPSVNLSLRDIRMRQIADAGMVVIPKEIRAAVAANTTRTANKMKFLEKNKNQRPPTVRERLALMEQDIRELRAIVMANGHANVLETINK